MLQRALAKDSYVSATLCSPTALLVAVMSLTCLGLLMSYSTTAVMAESSFGDSFFYFKRQLLFACLAIGPFVLGSLTPTPILRRTAYPLFLFSLALLVLVLVAGKEAGGAQRWLMLGPFRFQPGELYKFAVVVFLAHSLAKKKSQMHVFRIGILPHFLFPAFGMGLLLLQPDFGTAFLTLVFALTLVFVGGARLSHLLYCAFSLVPIITYVVIQSPYRLKRMVAFLDPWAHQQGIGYQIVQSLLSFGSGGFFGKGAGASTAKLYYLPAGHTDYVLAIAGEEFGFVGIALIVTLFIIIVSTGFYTALRHKDAFSKYLAIGMTLAITLQALLNMLVVMGLLPPKGITLPFVSYGGSSLLVTGFMAGVLYNLRKSLS